MKMKDIDFDKEILPKLLERKEFISNIILSGGECTLSSDFEEVVQKLYLNGFTVGIHTNGQFPDTIEKNIDEISFIGLDIKTVKDKYTDITNVKDVDFDKVIKTIKLAQKYNKEIQCRTTLFPKYVTLEDCVNIAKMLKDIGITKYTIQQYYPIGTAEVVEPYSEEYTKRIQLECSKILPTDLKIK
jgi:pyruvate formate lyase activating enzyme